MLLVPHWQGLGHLAPAKVNHTWWSDPINSFGEKKNSPHDEDGEADKDKKGATDANHGKCPEVDLPIP